jgi:hypothetical protein
VQGEGHILWDEFHHPRDRGWDSDALGPDDVTERERDYVYLAVRLFVRDRRFVDKTPESCLRVGYLDALFPDATFVFLRRRAAPNVASLVEAWKARPRFVKYRLPEPLTGLGDLSGSQWSFALVPGWRELKGASLEEICAAQYAACNEAALQAREGIAPERWIDVSYEALVAQPVVELEALYARLGALTVAERARLPGMEPKRADVIVAGCAVVMAAMRALGFDRVTVSDRGVRWGLLYDRFGRAP